MKKMNCWEFMKCGRQKGGNRVDEFGVCPAAKSNSCDGLNGGKYAGRACWAIAGTFCNGKVQGTVAIKIADCFFCEFYKKVKSEEGDHFTTFEELIDRIYA